MSLSPSNSLATNAKNIWKVLFIGLVKQNNISRIINDIPDLRYFIVYSDKYPDECVFAALNDPNRINSLFIFIENNVVIANDIFNNISRIETHKKNLYFYDFFLDDPTDQQPQYRITKATLQKYLLKFIVKRIALVFTNSDYLSRISEFIQQHNYTHIREEFYPYQTRNGYIKKIAHETDFERAKYLFDLRLYLCYLVDTNNKTSNYPTKDLIYHMANLTKGNYVYLPFYKYATCHIFSFTFLYNLLDKLVADNNIVATNEDTVIKSLNELISSKLHELNKTKYIALILLHHNLKEIHLNDTLHPLDYAIDFICLPEPFRHYETIKYKLYELFSSDVVNISNDLGVHTFYIHHTIYFLFGYSYMMNDIIDKNSAVMNVDVVFNCATQQNLIFSIDKPNINSFRSNTELIKCIKNRLGDILTSLPSIDTKQHKYIKIILPNKIYDSFNKNFDSISDDIAGITKNHISVIKESVIFSDVKKILQQHNITVNVIESTNPRAPPYEKKLHYPSILSNDPSLFPLKAPVGTVVEYTQTTKTQDGIPVQGLTYRVVR